MWQNLSLSFLKFVQPVETVDMFLCACTYIFLALVCCFVHKKIISLIHVVIWQIIYVCLDQKQ